MFDPIFEWLVSNTIVAGIIALIALASRLLGARPALAHFLWLLVIVKLVTPPIYNVPIEWGQETHNNEELVASNVLDLAEKDGNQLAVATMDRNTASSSQNKTANTFNIKQLLIGLWVLGSMIWLALALRRATRFHKMLACANPVGKELDSLIRGTAQRMKLKRLPQAVLIEGNLPPLLWAFHGRAKLALPLELMRLLSTKEQESLIAHELAHYKRGDHRLRWLEVVLLAAYWWHPLAWLARHELRRSEEDCCDAWVLWAYPDSGKEYARALMSALDFLSENSKPIPAAACGFGEVGKVKQIKERFEMILKKKPEHRMNWKQIVATGVLATLLMPLSAVVLETPLQAKEDVEAESTPTVRNDRSAARSTAKLESRLDKIEKAIGRLDKNDSNILNNNDRKRRLAHAQLELEQAESEKEFVAREWEFTKGRLEIELEKREFLFEDAKRQFKLGRLSKTQLNESEQGLKISKISIMEMELERDMKINRLDFQISQLKIEIEYLEKLRIF